MQPSDRQYTYRALQAFIQKHVADPADAERVIPADFGLLFDGHLHGWEAAILATLVSSTLWRGAAPGDCAQYAVTGDKPLPFEGCEQQIFDLLLANLRERTNDDGTPTRMINAVAELQSLLFTLMKRDEQAEETRGSTGDNTTNPPN